MLNNKLQKSYGELIRSGLPYIFGQMKNKIGINEVSKFLVSKGGLNYLWFRNI